jgi:hypothetical protein
VRLPAGRLVRSEGGAGEPVAWMTRAPVAQPGPTWSALSALHGQTGLVPILAPGRGDYLEAACQDTAAVAEVDRVDAAAMLEHLWAGGFPEPWQAEGEDREWADEMAAPFTGQFPGLAPAVQTTLARDVLAAALGSFPASRIALVPAGPPGGCAAGARLVPGQLG